MGLEQHCLVGLFDDDDDDDAGLCGLGFGVLERRDWLVF